jgi:hypothetical protein
MMDEQQLLSAVTAATAEFGATCKKYAGAITTELLKQALERHEIPTSPRDVFIEHVPVEIDFLIAKSGVTPRHRLLYRAQDVLMVFEVKKAGSFGQATSENTGAAFQLVCARNPKIECAYVTLTERRGYKWAVTEEDLGYPVYSFFWYEGSSEKKRRYEASGDFAKLLQRIRILRAQQA